MKTRTTWNHRVLAHDSKDGVYLQIHEVYYDEHGLPTSYTKEPVTVGSEDLNGIRWTLNKMKACLKKPILKAWKFPEVYTPK